MDKDRHWRELRWLGSVELVRKKFLDMHGRELSLSRARQVSSNYLQAVEYFKNAERADGTVKPLFLFYGVSSLSRCLVLTLRKSGGEETLKPGHGLSTQNWSQLLQPDVATSNKQLGKLEVKSCAGLFGDLIEETENSCSLHVRSSAVDWGLSYGLPRAPISITMDDIASRLPDLNTEYELWTSKKPLNALINDITYSEGTASVKAVMQENMQELLSYAGGRIKQKPNGQFVDLEFQQDDMPILNNNFLNPAFSAIPNLYLAKPFDGPLFLPQLSHSFALSYIVGMLCRYFPSHWMSLRQHHGSDSAWPLFQASMDYLELAFPWLVFDFLSQKVKS